MSFLYIVFIQKASQCADQAPAGEMVLREPSTSGPFENGTQVAYSCPDGYDLAGDTTAVCQYGNWTLDAVPSCAGNTILISICSHPNLKLLYIRADTCLPPISTWFQIFIFLSL